MGQVYAGYDEKLRRRVAVKAIRADGWAEPEARERLIREARALAKIDHPNICRVYDVLEEQGADYLALEFIDGRTLHEAIEAGLPTDEKIRIAVALADVLTAAHRAGVLHRDLKPENVMLTADGQVKVLDFGLARFLDIPAARRSRRSQAIVWPVPSDDPDATTRLGPPQPVSLRAIDSSQTQAGMVVGTPLYMSPEQARGDPLTAASDMYALGLLLQYLFTGVEPYPPDASARQVMEMAARGESLPYEGRDPDVRALIGALKHLAPTDRPTAAAAHRRLVLISERPKRRARRLAAACMALLLVAGAGKYATDLDRERTAAVAARNEAELRRQQADELIGFMLGDLRSRLDPVGRLDILDSVAEKALNYFAALPPDQLSPRDLWQKSVVLQQIGSLRMDQGKSEQAAAAFRQALRLAEVSTRRLPNDADAWYTLGRAHSYLGLFHYRSGDVNAGLREMQSYLAIAERLASRSPKNLRFQHEVLNAHSNLGSFSERRGDIETALLHYETALYLVTREAQQPRAPVIAQITMARETNKLAFALYCAGRIGEARRRFADERRILESILAADPKNQSVRQRLAVNRDYMAQCHTASGDVDGARRELAAAIEMQKAMIALDPANMTWRQNLAAVTRAFGDTLLLTDPARARASYEAAAEALRPVLAKPKKDPGPQASLASIETAFARALMQEGRAAAGMPHVERAVEILSSLSLDADRRRRLAAALVAQGEIEAALGRPAEARKSWERAAATLPPLTPLVRDPRIVDGWTRVLLHLGRPAEARPALDALQAMGYRSADFLAFCSRHHVLYAAAVGS
jgi:serine/threonine-protein kinase